MNWFVSVILFILFTLFVLHGQQAHSLHNNKIQMNETDRKLDIVVQYIKTMER